MIYVVLAVVLVILLVGAIDVVRNRHPLTHDEVSRLAAKRRRNRQLQEYQFCVQPRPANPDEKKAMKSTGEFVACDLDYHEAPSRIAGLLKYKKHEWIVFAFIARKRVVRLWWNKGPDGTRVWPLLPIATLQTLATTLGVEAIAVLHNHPNPNPSRFRVNSPSDADLNSAAHLHRMLVAMGGNLLEFICERGTCHLYYAAFAEAVVPMGPVLAEVAAANDKGVFPNYWLRKELSRTTLGDVVRGEALALQNANVVYPSAEAEGGRHAGFWSSNVLAGGPAA
jgi:hypothetical protein